VTIPVGCDSASTPVGGGSVVIPVGGDCAATPELGDDDAVTIVLSRLGGDTGSHPNNSRNKRRMIASLQPGFCALICR